MRPPRAPRPWRRPPRAPCPPCPRAADSALACAPPGSALSIIGLAIIIVLGQDMNYILYGKRLRAPPLNTHTVC